MEDFFAAVVESAGWPVGRADLHWLVLPDAETAGSLADPYRELTHRRGVAPIPPEWLHLTLFHGGPIEEYDAAELDATVERVREECMFLEPFELLFDRPAINNLTVERSGRPGAASRPLWELCARVDAEVTGGRFALQPPAHYPHISLAYGTGGPQRADHLSMSVTLSDLPGDAVPLRVERLVLAAESHNRQHFTWKEIAAVPLGTPAATGA